MITYKRHPIDGDINYLGVDDKKNIIFDGYVLNGSVSWVDVYSSKGKWKGKQIARFNTILYKK